MIAQRLVPALAMTQDEETADFVLDSGDITDAYLQVPQSKMRPLKLEGQTQVRFYISKCLPGQRDAARRWYDHLAKDIHEMLGGETCLEQPSMFRLPCACVILAHVDDLLFWGSETSLLQTVIPKLESKYRVNFHYAPKGEGGTTEFLKRVHVIEPDYTKMFIHAEKQCAKHCFDVYKQWTEKLKKSKVPGTPRSFSHSDTSTPLNEEMASIYRSLTGSLMYLSHDRVDLQFTTKSLASYLKTPTVHAWECLGQLISYSVVTSEIPLCISQASTGQSLFCKLNGGEQQTSKILVESYSDAGWLGS